MVSARPNPRPERLGALRRWLFVALEHGPVGGRTSQIVTATLVGLIVVNLAAVTLESVPAYANEYAAPLFAIEAVSLVVFTLEYLARLWVAGQHEGARGGRIARARWGYATSYNGIVDLLSVLPFWLALFLGVDLRVVLVFRVLRFLKLARYSLAVRSLLDALHDERRALLGCLLLFGGTALVAASLMYLAERHAQPDKFGTIPLAMWWAVATLGTTGYGDVVPVTPLGRLIAAATIVGALVMVALPVGIIATAFSKQIHRHDFVVTWGMVARVPLLAGLDAGAIADIMRLLRTEAFGEGEVIVRRGDPAHSLYFIASGAVVIELQEGERSLGPGAFFGELAVLRRRERSATVRATERTRLLVLDAADFRALLGRQPDLARRTREVVAERVGPGVLAPADDLLGLELAGSGKDGRT